MKVSRSWLAGMLVTVALMGMGAGLIAAWTVGVDHRPPAPHVTTQLWPLHPDGVRWA